MSRALSEDVLNPVKDLITEISGFRENTAPFNRLLKYFITTIKKSDTMYFLNKRDIDQNILSMSEKFCFHGFFPHADALKAAYRIYLPELLPKFDTNARLNVVKFLLCMSEAPTKHFIEHQEMYVPQPVLQEEDIDWVAYLNDGIEKWDPNFDEPSESESSDSMDETASKEALTTSYSEYRISNQIKSSEKMCVMDLKTNREELLATIQHSWYNQNNFIMEPESKWREANIGILWENHLRDQVQGLILLRPPSFITEYKVIREILWQFRCSHTSSTFELCGNSIKPRPDVTLASVRSYAFYNFLEEFIPYIEILDFFREFERSVLSDLEHDTNRICRTYQSYCSCINSIISPIYEQLSNLEDQVRQQETTYTLLKIADDLNKIFEPLKLLKGIHEEVIMDHNIKSPLECATMLIVKLHDSLKFTSDKLEQDLKITLFLESIYHYLGLVDFWLIKDDLPDYTGEFVIEKKITSDRWHTKFVSRENINPYIEENSFIQIFLQKVLKMAKNINFLRLLKKYDVIGDCQETIYEEFVENVFKKLKKFNNDNDGTNCHSSNDENVEKDDTEILTREENFIFPVLSTEVSETNPDLQRLENLVDVEDGFLMTAFEDFFVKKPQITKNEKQSLYRRISEITTNLFPKMNFFENIFINILEKRFTISGLKVKNLLIEEHLLEKKFKFLQHLYLFSDDLIFPFYRRLFENTESSNKNWANDIWLTSHLQDIFMDMYPEFYENCSVQIKEGWSQSMDSLAACTMINVIYEMPWPLNIIIKQEQIEMYKDIFKFLLKLKWALHTLNHLLFSDLESKGRPPKKAQKSFKSHHTNKATAKLVRLKFYLINILNSLQHFVFGFVFSKNLLKFELDFEKAYDLNSLIESHSDFIISVSTVITDLKKLMMEKDKYNNVLNCVKLLKVMWNNLKYATTERISDCYGMYHQFYADINPIISPVHLYDY